MALKVVCFANYLTNINCGPWRDGDWGSNKFVHALKGHALKGESWIPVVGKQKKLNNANASAAIGWFAEMVADYWKNHVIKSPVSIVPIPNSDSVVGAAAPHTKLIADAVATKIGSNVLDIVRCKEPLQSSRSGGPRAFSTLYDNFTLIGKIPKGQRIILVDDVLTTGGHLTAAAARLSEGGGKVEIGFCGGRTVQQQQEDCFSVIEVTVEDPLDMFDDLF